MSVPAVNDIKDLRGAAGRFAAGNTLAKMVDQKKGWQQPSSRMKTILSTKTYEEIFDIYEDPIKRKKLSSLDAIIYSRIVAASEQNASANGAASIILDKVEPTVTKTELTGKDGNPLAIATADVTGLLSDISGKITDD